AGGDARRGGRRPGDAPGARAAPGRLRPRAPGAEPMSGTPAGTSMVSLIERKKRGGEMTEAELRWICAGFLRGDIPDYQVSAWLMAVRWRGMGEEETLALTHAMVASGATLDWSHLGRPVVDKHSTGGVG